MRVSCHKLAIERGRYLKPAGLYPHFGSLNSAEKLSDAIEREAPNQQASPIHIQFISATIRHIATLDLSCLGEGSQDGLFIAADNSGSVHGSVLTVRSKK